MERKNNPWLGFIPYLFSLFVVMMLVMVSSPTLPMIMSDYGLSAAELPWQNTMYTLGAAVLAPVLGWFGDVRGMKKTMVLGLIFFAFGLALCGIGPSYTIFCVGSIMRGFATAAVIPATMFYIATNFPQEKSVGAYAMITVASSLGCAIGPAVAGVLVTMMSWRTLFLASAAVAAVCVLVVLVGVKKLPAVAPDKKLDSIGSILLFVFFGAFLSALTLSSTMGWSSIAVLVLLALSVASFILFYKHEKKSEVCLVNVELFKNRGFIMPTLIYCLQNCLSAFVITGASYFITAGMGLEASVTGVWMLVQYLLAFVFGLFAGKVSALFSERILMYFCIVCWGAGLGICCIMNGGSPVYLLFIMAALFAAGNAFMPGLTQAIALRHVDPSETAMASGTITMVNQAGAPIITALVIPYLSIIGAENGIPNYGVSFGKTSMLMLIVVGFAVLLAILTPVKESVEK